MDTHNLATVIAPNILLRDAKSTGMEDSFLAVEAVHMLLEYNDEMCEVSSVTWTFRVRFSPSLGPRRYPNRVE